MLGPEELAELPVGIARGAQLSVEALRVQLTERQIRVAIQAMLEQLHHVLVLREGFGR